MLKTLQEINELNDKIMSSLDRISERIDDMNKKMDRIIAEIDSIPSISSDSRDDINYLSSVMFGVDNDQ